MDQQIEGYRTLRGHLDNYQQIQAVDFGKHAAAQYKALRRSRSRIGTMDLKIAAIALASDATLLTWNLADFYQVSGLKVEVWTG